MGKKIDRFMLTSVLTVAFFLYFDAAFQNRTAAILLSVAGCWIFSKAIRRIRSWIQNTSWQQKRKLRRNSNGTLIQLACMDGTEAQPLIQGLLSDAYQNEAPIELELLHPVSPLSREKVFAAWRKHRGEEKLVLCTTGRCTSEIRIFASSFKAPKLAIIDADALSQIMAEYPQTCFTFESEQKRHKLRFNRILQFIFNRQNAPRCILFSFSMLVMYVFSGSIWYLISSLFLLFVALSSLKKSNRPIKLF